MRWAPKLPEEKLAAKMAANVNSQNHCEKFSRPASRRETMWCFHTNNHEMNCVLHI